MYQVWEKLDILYDKDILDEIRSMNHQADEEDDDAGRNMKLYHCAMGRVADDASPRYFKVEGACQILSLHSYSIPSNTCTC
jgi:hypothetical protein